jgi:hypothetical protein
MCWMIVAFNNGGWRGIEKYITIVSKLCVRYFDIALQYVTN